MKYKLPLSSGIPLVIRKGKGELFFQIQYGVIKKAENSSGYYNELFCMEETDSLREIGEVVEKLLTRFQEHPTWTTEEVCTTTGMDWETYLLGKEEKTNLFLKVEDARERDLKLSKIYIKYASDSRKYMFGLAWPVIKGKKYHVDSSVSTGKPGLLTFPTPLEFDSTIAPETLGRMVLEAFDRCQQLTDAAAGDKFEVKELTLFDGSVLEIQMPRDKHFSDSGDMGTAEIYQMYEYFPKEDAEDAQAQFFLGIGEELNCDISQDNIAAVWESNYGKAEFLEIKAVKQGIYCLRAELRNKTIHKVSYFTQQNKELLLECSMEVFQPGKRKKLDEKLSELFEEFAGRCRRKCC